MRIPIYSALNKPNLLFGCDRELFLMTCVASSALIFVGASIITAVIGIMLFLIVVFLLRLMAKKDPYMQKIFVKQLRYAKFYTAKSSIHRFK